MGEVIIGDGARQVRGKGICQAASDQADILVAVYREAYARGCGSDVRGFRERIVKVKLESVAELLAQAFLQRVVGRTADGAPSIHGKSLVIQEFTGTAVGSSGAVEVVGVKCAAVVPQPTVCINVS